MTTQHYVLTSKWMCKDGYVTSVETVPYTNTEYVAVKPLVKPRTNDKDPVTRKSHYSCWIIMKNSSEASIQSAYCTCKGGVDGSCRHVVATLFEVLDFVDDYKKSSCTSIPCVWVRRASQLQQLGQPVTAADLDTSVTSEQSSQTPMPLYCPLSTDYQTPDPGVFFSQLRQLHPSACALRAVYDCSKRDEPIKPLSCLTPTQKVQQFCDEHKCIVETCQCSNIFVNYHLEYTSEECEQIEELTRGQSNNTNWHSMRKGLLTASNYHKILHSTNINRTAESLLSSNSFDGDFVPDAIRFGRCFESKARDMFMKAHRFSHRGNVSVNIPGLIISLEDPILACSPDGMVDCKHCGKFLLEIKCLYKYKYFHPKNALKLSTICTSTEEEGLQLRHSHAYFAQVQGQMGVTGLRKCMLVGYTHKGICSVPVEFDDEFWQNAKPLFYKFYTDAYFAVLKKMFVHDSK